MRDQRLDIYQIFDGTLIECDLSKPVERMIPFNSYETAVTKKFLSLIKEGDVVFDVGSWIGYYTLLAARKVGSMGKVVSIEPHPRNVDRIRRNVEINNLTNVTILNIAVGDRTSTSSLLESKNPHNHRVKVNNDNNYPSIPIKIYKLDDIIDNYGIHTVDLLIIDIEGYEYNALIGLKNHLSKGLVKNLICEIHSEFLEEYSHSERDIITILTENGFTIELITKRKLGTRMYYNVYAKFMDKAGRVHSTIERH